MRLTEKRLRNVIRSIIRESALDTWSDTQGKINASEARSYKSRGNYRYPEDFDRLKSRMPSNYPLVDPDGAMKSGGARELMAYGEHVDAFIPMYALIDRSGSI